MTQQERTQERQELSSADAARLIEAGEAALGIEFGSTRIKACLIAPDTTPLAVGSHTWQDRLENGIYVYRMEDVWRGLYACYAALADDVEQRYGVRLRKLSALGVSGMMHGYVALDQEGALLVPFRTWRNNITADACAELTPLLKFAVPQRFSIAHLYQAILEEQPHLPRLARLTTLAGYVHAQLTGEHSMGVGEASGMFPIDSETNDFDVEKLELFDRHVSGRKLGWKLRDLLPRVLPAGAPAGRLTERGARLLDPTGQLQAGAPLCPPEGDAGTGMVATNAVRPRSGNVSAGTSVFAMIVLERPLSRVHEEIDIVTTPDGKPVAMVHSNNGSSDLDAWINLFGEAAEALGLRPTPDELYGALVPQALAGDPDAGGLVAINYVSGEHVTGFEHGRPLVVRKPDANFSLANFMRAALFSSLCALRTGMNILTEKEGVVVEEIRGHGGFFKGGQTGQRLMAAALDVPVSLPETAGEGGAWGMAVLAAFTRSEPGKLSLPDYLDARVASRVGTPFTPDPRDVQGFSAFFERHAKGLAIERTAIDTLV